MTHTLRSPKQLLYVTNVIAPRGGGAGVELKLVIQR